MGLRPQTLYGYGIADWPVGLAAYFPWSRRAQLELISRVFEGESEGLTRDDILDDITITWLTNTALSGARLYWENWDKLGYFNAEGVSIPVAVSVFPDELYPAPRSWAEMAYPKLIHYKKIEKGGHFAAWEHPQFFSEELRAGFRPLRSMVLSWCDQISRRASMIEVFLFRLPADISRRPQTWSTQVRVELAVSIHQVITSKTGHPARPMGLTPGGDAEEEAAATCAHVDLMYMHFEEFAHFIAHKISRPNRSKED
jgi:hypothetical protein